MPERSEATIEAAGMVFGLSGLLRSTWHDLTPLERDRLLTDLVANAAALRNSLEQVDGHGDGPTGDQIRIQLTAPTSRVVFQPVVWLPTREVVGFEALTRFPNWSPDQWFRHAWEIGTGLEFELQAVARALPTVALLPREVYLAINVSPVTLISRELLRLVKASDPERIVLEVTEHQPIGEYELYRDELRSLRRLGLRIAVDDAGAGHSSLKHILQLGPDIIKLDRDITADCDKDPARRALMISLANFGTQTRTSLVAEGIETAEEAAALVSYGIAFGQGYHFGRPNPTPRLRLSPETGAWFMSPEPDGSS